MGVRRSVEFLGSAAEVEEYEEKGSALKFFLDRDFDLEGDGDDDNEAGKEDEDGFCLSEVLEYFGCVVWSALKEGVEEASYEEAGEREHGKEGAIIPDGGVGSIDPFVGEEPAGSEEGEDDEPAHGASWQMKRLWFLCVGGGGSMALTAGKVISENGIVDHPEIPEG